MPTIFEKHNGAAKLARQWLMNTLICIVREKERERDVERERERQREAIQLADAACEFN